MKKLLSAVVIAVVLVAGVQAAEVNAVLSLQDLWNFRESVRFGTNSAAVSQQDQAILQNAANAAKNNAEAVISVEGHTDERGSAVANQRLSVRRAQAVKNLLVARYGVNASQVKVTGFGEEHPIASNATAEGMALNRRVEIRLYKSGTPNIGSWTPWGTGERTIDEQTDRNPNVGSYTPTGDLTPLTERNRRTPNVGNAFPAPSLNR